MSTRPERVESFVDEQIQTLQRTYRSNSSAGTAALAILRRGVGTSPGTDMELLGLALSGPQTELVDPRRRLPDEPVPEERAAFAAVTLYAMHQQSRRDAAMHVRGYSLGRSTRLLARKVERESVRRRFIALGTATTWDETVHHARGLIQQLRQHSIPLDYGRFAADLFELHEGRGDAVRMRWGRDFYRTHHAVDDGTAASDTPDQTTTA